MSRAARGGVRWWEQLSWGPGATWRAENAVIALTHLGRVKHQEAADVGVRHLYVCGMGAVGAQAVPRFQGYHALTLV